MTNHGFSDSHIIYIATVFPISLCLCRSISVCFDLVLIPVEKFLQKRAPFTALQNSESTAYIF